MYLSMLQICRFMLIIFVKTNTIEIRQYYDNPLKTSQKALFYLHSPLNHTRQANNHQKILEFVLGEL